MKEYLRQLVDETPNYLLKKSVAREYLQTRILQSIQDDGMFLSWAFLGGTALRFLYNMPRYSEDLDFSLVNADEKCPIEDVLRKVKSLLEAENYNLQIKAARIKTVMSAFIKFPGLLYEMGISPHRHEVLSIKFEIDTNPPHGAVTATSIVRRFVTLNINHYDKASLFSGKLHAILSRQYTKGRDLYDFVWYLSDRSWPAPNMEHLNAALEQTGWKGPSINSRNLKKMLAERMHELHWNKVQADLLPFLERLQDLDLVTRDNCVKLISEKRFM